MKGRGEGVPENEKKEASQAFKNRVRKLFLDFHSDIADTPFNASVSRLLSSVLTKLKDQPLASVRWDRGDEGLLEKGLSFASAESAVHWFPSTPADLVETLEKYRSGALPTANTKDSIAFATTDVKSQVSSPELNDVMFFEATLREKYDINFIVQRGLFDNEEFIRSSRTALERINTYLRALSPEKTKALSGITINLTGQMSGIAIALAESRFRRALLNPDGLGAAWKDSATLCINPALLNFEAKQLGANESLGILETIFAEREVLGYEKDLKGDRDDIGIIAKWLKREYGISGLDIPPSWQQSTDSDESRRTVFVVLSRLARQIRNEQMERVANEEEQVNELTYTADEVREILANAKIHITDSSSKKNYYHLEATEGDRRDIYISESFEEYTYSYPIRDMLRERRDADR